MNTSQHSEHHATTTEELIVQYLDGELVRKELEGVLFERLARSEDARMLLREHLMLRGAIRETMEHDQFQLSSDLDMRTRARIEEMLKQGTNVPGVIANADRAAIATNPATRSLRRWALRPAYAALLLLLTVGTTWYLTRSTTGAHVSGPSVAMNQPAANVPAPAVAAPEATTPSPAVTTPASSKATDKHAAVREVIKYVKVPVEVPMKEMAQNTQAVAQPTRQQAAEQVDPAASMISHYYGKLLSATAKREVIVSSKDRL